MLGICITVMVVAVAAVAITGLIIAYKADNPKPPKHLHTWKITGVRPMKTYRSTFSYCELPARTYSVVAERCTACGFTKTFEIEGHWTVEGLTSGRG